MNLFGWQKEVMAQDNKEVSPEKQSAQAGRVGKKEVDLFPALIERKSPAIPMVPSRLGSGPVGTQISLFTPVSFDEALDIVECLRSRTATTICLEKMRKVDAGRLVDFVMGASAAIDGDYHKMSEQVYLFCPSNFKIVSPGKSATGSLQSKSAPGPLDFLYPERFSLDKFGYSNLGSKS